MALGTLSQFGSPLSAVNSQLLTRSALRRVARRPSSLLSFAVDQGQIDLGQRCKEKNRLELRQLELERQGSKATPSHPYRATVSR
jgi:hypothetical protein